MKKIILVTICGVALFGCLKLLQAQNQYEYNKAIKRCGGSENVLINHTQQGDTYYSCKVEK